MKPERRRTPAAALCLLAVWAAQALLPPAQGEEPAREAPLPIDPAIRMGRLPNGLRFWIRRHNRPEGKLHLWLRIASGSLNEEESQRGLAHFLEHMAFNGSANFPPGTLIPYFQSLGMRFGHDQNAFTGYDRTVYVLSLPDVREATLRKGLVCLADYGFRLNLSAEELEKERGVVLSEVRSRKGAGQRLQDQLMPVYFPASRVAERLPIGVESVIQAADRDLLLAYYRKWYRPDKALLMAVGDADPKEVERWVREEFNAWPEALNPSPDLPHGVQPREETRACVVTDPEFTGAELTVVKLMCYRPTETVSQFRARLVERLATSILDRRLEALRKRGAASYQQADAGVHSFLRYGTEAEARVNCPPEKWRAAFSELLTELRRVRVHGFLEEELEAAREEMLSGYERAAQTESTREAQAFLQEMDRAAAHQTAPMSASQKLELARLLLPTLNVRETSDAFRRDFAPYGNLYVAVLPRKPEPAPPSEAELLAVVREVDAGPVDPPVARSRLAKLLEQDPEPAQVKEQKEDPELKILSLTLANGARVHLRSMDFKKNEVHARLTLAGGVLRETPVTRGLSEAAALAFRQPATRRHDSITIRDYMTGRKAGVSGAAGNDFLSLTVSGSPGDFEEAFRLAYLLLTQGRVEPSALRNWKDRELQELEERKSSVEEQMRERFFALLCGGDPRFRSLTKDRIEQISVETAQAWLDEHLKSAPLEACIVGDLPRDQMLLLARKYLGALPPRPRVLPDSDALRVLKPDPGPHDATVAVETITPRAEVLVAWRGAVWRNLADRRALSAAFQIFQTRAREEIREKRGLTYSIGAFSHASRVYPLAGLAGIIFSVDPAKAGEAAKLARELAEKYAQDGPSDAELETYRKQVRNHLEKEQREPSYWASVLSDLEYHGEQLKNVKEELEKLTALTKDDLLDALRRHLTEPRRIQVIATPKAPPPPK